jgi:oligogalacturonide transporter
MRIRAFRLHLGMYLGGYVSQDFVNPVLGLIVSFIFAGSLAASFDISLYMAIAQLFSVGAAIWFLLRTPPTRAYRTALVFFAAGIVGLISLYVARVDDITWYFSVVVVAGLGRGALNYIPWSVYNYMPDVDQIVTGRRREGAFAGVMTFARKMLQTGVILLVGAILDLAGLVKGVKIQPAQVVNAAVIVMAVGAFGLMIFGYLVSLRFKLNRETHAVLMDEIERFKRGATTPPTAENRAVVEDLTGWKYEELWGKGKSAR